MQEQLYNLAFERSVLSSILFDPQIIEDINVRAHDFYLPAHIAIFSSMELLNKKDMPIDEEFIKKELIKQKVFDEQAMLEIMSVNPISNIKPYVSEVVEKARLRRFVSLTSAIKKIAIEDQGTSDEVVATIEKYLQDLDESSDIEMPMDMNAADAEFDNMVLPPLIKTGIKAIDDMLCGGIESSQLVHIGGDSNVGKTLLTKQILKNVADENKSLFFSYEMPKWKITRQLKGKNFKRQNYFITDTKMMKGRDIIDTARMIKRMHRIHNIRFVVIDSKIKLTNNHYKGHSSVEKIAEIDAILATLCQELDIVIFMITQLSKEDQRNGTMSGYGSGMSDYEADMKLLLSFEGDLKDPKRKLEVKKNRQDVNYEPVTLQLDTKSLEFTSTVVETIYDSHLPFGGTKINVTHRPKLMPDKPAPIDSDMIIGIEGAQFL